MTAPTVEAAVAVGPPAERVVHFISTVQLVLIRLGRRHPKALCSKDLTYNRYVTTPTAGAALCPPCGKKAGFTDHQITTWRWT